jgi:hypothetical protein
MRSVSLRLPGDAICGELRRPQAAAGARARRRRPRSRLGGRPCTQPGGGAFRPCRWAAAGAGARTAVGRRGWGGRRCGSPGRGVRRDAAHTDREAAGGAWNFGSAFTRANFGDTCGAPRFQRRRAPVSAPEPPECTRAGPGAASTVRRPATPAAAAAPHAEPTRLAARAVAAARRPAGAGASLAQGRTAVAARCTPPDGRARRQGDRGGAPPGRRLQPETGGRARPASWRAAAGACCWGRRERCGRGTLGPGERAVLQCCLFGSCPSLCSAVLAQHFAPRSGMYPPGAATSPRLRRSRWLRRRLPQGGGKCFRRPKTWTYIRSDLRRHPRHCWLCWCTEASERGGRRRPPRPPRGQH